MYSIVSAELYKFWKKKIFLALIIMNMFSLIYALGMFFEWGFIAISGKIDIVAFTVTMWSLLMMLGIPLFFFAYLGASIFGGEIVEGQILLQITRVKSRKQLVGAKVISVLVVIVLTYLFNILFSMLCYICFAAHSSHGYSQLFIVGNYSISMMASMILTNLITVFLLMLFATLSMHFSIKFGIFRAVIFTLIVYVALKFAVSIQFIAQWIPGYYTFIDTAEFSVLVMSYQFLIIILIIIGIVQLSKRVFEKKQF